MRQQKLRHLVHVLFLLHVLHCLLHRRQRRVLRLPGLLLREVTDQPEKALANDLHLRRLGHSVNALLARVEKLILILLALLVVHALDPFLELALRLVHLQHEAHAAFQGEIDEVRHRLAEELHPLLHIAHEPLDGQAPQTRVRLPGTGHGGHELGGLQALLQLGLEEVRLHGCHIRERLDALLQQVLLLVLRQRGKDLHQDTDRGEQGRPCFLLRLGHDLADQQEGRHFVLHLWRRQAVLNDLPKLRCRLHNLVLQGGHAVLQQPQRGLAALHGAGGARVGHSED
mmetsp:Transcript_76341/g.182762  ORF Transcript_76341/g.182762 Transcript_76341/m.182762 type:complete len:285 (+) Transcript_76341:2126-2980(+)